MTNKEILETIKQINKTLTETIIDAEESKSIEFYKERIKLSALNIFEQAQLLSNIDRIEINTQIPDTKTIKQQIIEPVLENAKPTLKPESLMVTDEPKAIETVELPAPVIEHKKPEPTKHQIIASEPQVNNNNGEEDKSLNAKIAKYQQPVINVGDKLKDTPIKELAKAISISKKFEFINELFNGKSDTYKSCIQTIENSQSYSDAKRYIESDIAENFDWKENEKLATEFFELVRRKFL